MTDYAPPIHAALRARRVEETAVAALWRRFDWVLLSAVAAIVGYGLWAIAGITRNEVEGNPDYYVIRQAVYALVGAAGLVAAAFVDPELLRRGQRVIYGLLLGLIAIVWVAGVAARGSQRWIDMGFFTFQPSEFGKLLFVLFLAGFLADRAKRIGEARTVLIAVGLAVVPMLLVFRQPDIGTTLVYGAALAAVLFVAGTRWRDLAVLGALTALCALAVLWLLPAAGVEVLKPYQKDRLTAFANPDLDTQRSTYNANQSITAVGSGGITGRGVAGATQTNFDYLPEEATDFVFAALAEQRGFAGVSVLLLLYLLVVWRGLKIIAVARDAFSAIVAGGIVVALLFQIFVNVGMTIGIAPITGIPLPFVSVGGSSMVSNLLAIGVLQAIHARARSTPPRRPR